MIIETDADHKAALSQISALMDAEAGTPDAAKLVELAEAVEAYEAKRYPIDPPTPEQAIAFRREQERTVVQFSDYKPPTCYSVHIASHWDGTLTIEVVDVQVDDRSMRAVADDLERAAALLRSRHGV